MMRPGAGQNYPRSGFPLEGKATHGLFPLLTTGKVGREMGEVAIAPCQETGTDQPGTGPLKAASTRGCQMRRS